MGLAHRILAVLWGVSLFASSCADDASGSGDAGADTDADTDTDTDTDADTDADADADTGCDPLPAPDGNVVHVTVDQVADLPSIVNGAGEGDTIALGDGTYALDGAYLWISAPGVTLRSESGDPDAVVLDGGYATTEVVTVAASDVTIAELTIRRAYTHAIHVVTGEGADTLNTSIYRVHVVDPREQSIKINPSADDGAYPDYGTVACSTVELTDEGRPEVSDCYTGGVDAHRARGWTIRDNRIEGFWCESGLSEHAIHFWDGCRDTVVVRNVLVDDARGVGFGMLDSGDGRPWDDDPCPGAGEAYVDHVGGVIADNFIAASRAELFASESGADCGICLWSACGAAAVHNSIAATSGAFSSIEWRFAGAADVVVVNNLGTDPFYERDSATAAVDEGNLAEADAALFVDPAGSDLHLAPTASAAIDQGTSYDGAPWASDIDGEARDDGEPDIGADEISE
jgi:hypothetical protein